MPRLAVAPWDLSGRRAHAKALMMSGGGGPAGDSDNDEEGCLEADLALDDLSDFGLDRGAPSSPLSELGGRQSSHSGGAGAHWHSSSDAAGGSAWLHAPNPTVFAVSHGDSPLARVTLCRVRPP